MTRMASGCAVFRNIGWMPVEEDAVCVEGSNMV